MLVAAAFVPAAPVMNPQIAAGAANELDDFRSWADDAIRVLLAAEPDLIVVLGEAARSGPYGAEAVADLSPWGGPVRDGPGEPLPLALAMGTWWLDRNRSAEPRLIFGIGSDDPVERCRNLGEPLAARADRVAALVVGGGSACRTAQAPGAFDERSADIDAALCDAIGTADLETLFEMDIVVAAALRVDGRAPFQVAAAMAAARPTDGGTCEAVLHGTADPYGVLYLAASWRWTS